MGLVLSRKAGHSDVHSDSGMFMFQKSILEADGVDDAAGDMKPILVEVENERRRVGPEV